MEYLRPAAFLATLVSLHVCAGCSAAKPGSVSVDQQEAALSAGISTLNGILDEQVGTAGFVRNRTPSLPVRALEEVLPRASAAACTRAISQACTSGSKGITYSGCTGRAGVLSYEGTVQLDWSGNGDCVLDNGETVTRTAAVTIDGPYGGALTITSENATDYSGTTIGGGGSLTQTSANTWHLAVAGKHKTLIYRGREIYDVSVQTGTPIGVSGTIARAGRTVNGGTLIVRHNTAGFTATYAPVNLTYSNFFCYPQAGSINVTYSDSQTGSATITFTGDNTARVTKDGKSWNVDLEYCE